MVSYSCTSGSIVIGEERVFEEEIKQGCTLGQTHVSSSPVFSTHLRELDAKKFVVGTPVPGRDQHRGGGVPDRASGIEILDIQGLNLTTGIEFGRVTPAYWKKFALAIDRPDADAIFLSAAAASAALEVVDEIEQAAGKPVVTSNQAQFWSCLRRAGLRMTSKGSERSFPVPGAPCCQRQRNAAAPVAIPPLSNDLQLCRSEPPEKRVQ